MINNFDPKKHKIYNPINRKKYVGKSNPICRSSWEYAFCKYLDFNPNVIEWSSESLAIKYMFLGKPKTYYPDFIVKMNSNKGVYTWVIDVKPYKETIPPKINNRKSRKTKLYEEHTWQKNKQKWKYASAYCKKFGYKFTILTEKELF